MVVTHGTSTEATATLHTCSVDTNVGNNVLALVSLLLLCLVATVVSLPLLMTASANDATKYFVTFLSDSC